MVQEHFLFYFFNTTQMLEQNTTKKPIQLEKLKQEVFLYQFCLHLVKIDTTDWLTDIPRSKLMLTLPRQWSSTPPKSYKKHLWTDLLTVTKWK